MWIGAAHAEPIADAATVLDFMIQDVCLNAHGAVLSGMSPIDGCARHRDLRPGEPLPYHKHDHPSPGDRNGAPEGYQRHDSFPVTAAPFGLVVEDSFDFGTGGRRFGVFDGTEGDGGDIVVLSPEMASIAATQDGGAGFQLFAGPGCSGTPEEMGLANSWIIAALDPAGHAPLRGEIVARLRDLTDGAQGRCPASLGFAFTRWSVQPIRYRAAPGQGTPVPLETLVSEHFGGRDPATADHVERFYFTRELGSTRWERWQSLEKNRGLGPSEVTRRAADLATSGRCGPTPPPERAARMAMIDCREWTLIAPSADPAGDPPAFFVAHLRQEPAHAGLFAPPPP